MLIKHSPFFPFSKKCYLSYTTYIFPDLQEEKKKNLKKFQSQIEYETEMDSNLEEDRFFNNVHVSLGQAHVYRLQEKDKEKNQLFQRKKISGPPISSKKTKKKTRKTNRKRKKQNKKYKKNFLSRVKIT